MTYEEAKMQIQAITEKIWDQLSEPDREAMEMAFSALQAQANESKTRNFLFTESGNESKERDLILRQAAIDAIVDCTVYGNADDLKEAVMQENAWNKWSGGVLEALEAVEEVLSAQPERKNGRWEMKPDPFGFFGEIPVCSECGCTTKMRDKTKFCPHCGAQMEGQ